MEKLKGSLLIFSLVSLFLLLIPISSAEIDVRSSEVGTCLVAPYEFTLNITNNQKIEDTFYVETSGEYSKWAWVNNKILKMDPGRSEKSKISVFPSKDAKMGEHFFEVLIQSRTNKSVQKSKQICFVVFRNYSMEAGNFSISKKSYDPGETVKVSAVAKNTGSKDFEEVTFSSNVLKNDKILKNSSKTFKLETGSKKESTLMFDLGKYQEPGSYKVEYKIKARGRIFDKGGDNFEVRPIHDENIKETSETGFLSSTYKIKVENNGNAPYHDKIERNFSYPLAILISSESAEVTNHGFVDSYSWKVSLSPRDNQSFQYKINYWPLYIILILIGFGVYRAYLYLRIPTISKKVRKTELSEDKRIFTISLEIKNWLFGKPKDIILEDSVPSVARVIEEFDTLEPDIEKKEDETVLRWKIGSIKPGDERVLHYKVKTLVEAVDYLKLPEAVLEGKVKGKEFKKKSSGVKLEV